MIQELDQALAGHYRIERVLGRNGFIVYLARDLSHDRDVALWVTRPDREDGARASLAEAGVAFQLDHPHILPLLDSGFAAGFLYYVMPHIDGGSLRDRLLREKQPPIAEAIRITREAADALGYAHEQGVIHGDMRPESILFSGWSSVLVDFDFPRRSQWTRDELADLGISVGTPEYMSPEQASGQSVLDGRSDIYSLACVLYEMLAGAPPHTGASAEQTITKVIAEPVKPVTELWKSTPPYLAAALSRALERLPADRFATALEFADALERRPSRR